MIKRKIKLMTFLSAGMLFGLVSCDGLGGESIYDLDKSGEIDEIKKEIIDKVGDILVYEVNMTSQEELETSINDVTLVTSYQATEGTLNRKNFQLSAEGEPDVKVIDSEFSVRVYQKNDPKKLSEIDFAMIDKNIETAKSQIPSEFVDHALFDYKIEFDDNKRADKFTINTLMDGENNHMEGNDLVTNYYEFFFEIDEEGAVVMVAD